MKQLRKVGRKTEKNNDRERLKGIDPVRRLEILIDGDEELDVRGIRSRIDRLEKLVVTMLIISTLTALGSWLTGSDGLAAMLQLIFTMIGD